MRAVLMQRTRSGHSWREMRGRFDHYLGIGFGLMAFMAVVVWVKQTYMGRRSGSASKKLGGVK